MAAADQRSARGFACGAAGWWRSCSPSPWPLALAWAPASRPAGAQFDLNNPQWVGIPAIPKVPTATSTLGPERSERADARARR